MSIGKKNMPIRWVIILGFLLVIFVSNTIIGYLVFSEWFSTTRELLNDFIEATNQKLILEVDAKLSLPEQINASYYKIFRTGLLDLADEQQRDKFFVGVLESQVENIYSFSFGTSRGEYYGARRNENGIIEIMRNENATGGHSWYYSVAEDLTAKELVLEAGEFDPRTRDWYQVAVTTGEPNFSPIYKHFIMPDLTISHARPVYDEAGLFLGVLSSHMLLGDLGDFLAEIIQPYGGYAVIFEKDTNRLVANSLGEANFGMLGDGVLERYGLAQIGNKDLLAAYAQYEDEHESNFLYKGKGRNLYINVKKIQKPGLDWVIISAVPEGFLIAPVLQSIRSAVMHFIVLAVVALIVFILITKRLFSPLNDLLAATKAFTQGDLSKKIQVVRQDEIGKVSEAFNEATEQMGYLVNNLETAVQTRTDELLHLSFRDQLTGLHNRRCFYENMAKLDNSTTLPLSVIYADINGLKLTNDICGHAAGDELIKKTAMILREACRQGDFLARLGGDEFVILLPNTEQENANVVLKRIRAAFRHVKRWCP